MKISNPSAFAAEWQNADSQVSENTLRAELYVDRMSGYILGIEVVGERPAHGQKILPPGSLLSPRDKVLLEKLLRTIEGRVAE